MGRHHGAPLGVRQTRPSQIDLTMHELIAIDLPGGPDFVDALQRIWDAGDAAFPVDRRLPLNRQRELMDQFGVAAIVDTSGRTALTGGIPTETGDALVVATSGSTGQPKGAVLTHEAIRASALATSAHLGVTSSDHWLACLPLAHVGGLSVITRALVTNTPLTVIDGFDADVVAHSSATLVSLVSTALVRTDTSHYRVVVLGGSRPPAQRPANTVTTYGMTETGSGVVYDGRPLHNVEVRIVDDEVQLRAPMLLRCYRDGHDPRTPDGWFPTGDTGRWLPDGRLHVEGRRGDVIVTGGEKVWPEPVEAVLTRHPDLDDVAVNGTPDPEWGAVVTAHIVTSRDDLSIEELRDFARAELPGWALPRRLVRRSMIPRTALGKVQRHQLNDTAS